MLHNEYELATEAQNNGGCCRHCKSTSGHFGVCPLITGEFFTKPETETAENWPTFNEVDKLYAHTFGVEL